MVNRVGDGNKSTKPNASEGHSEDDKTFVQRPKSCK